MIRRYYDSFENQVERAERAAKDFLTDKRKRWFLSLLEILKQKKYARILICPIIPKEFLEKDNMTTKDTTRFVDVEKIAHTNKYASFFDIVNNSDMVDYETPPVVVERLEYPIRFKLI